MNSRMNKIITKPPASWFGVVQRVPQSYIGACRQRTCISKQQIGCMPKKKKPNQCGIVVCCTHIDIIYKIFKQNFQIECTALAKLRHFNRLKQFEFRIIAE